MPNHNPDELGALWVKEGKKGKYLTGTINGVAVVCFKNDRKTGNQPDFRVLKSKARTDARDARPELDTFTSDDVAF